MDPTQRLQLQQMISEHNVEDNTALIRQLKHSHVLRTEINALLALKAKGSDAWSEEAMIECSFLFTYYTDLYNKIRKDEIDLSILFQALDVLASIEEGKVDQHEGAFQFGQLLKQIYIDSALKKSAKLEEEHRVAQMEYQPSIPNLSWSEWKKQQTDLLVAELDGQRSKSNSHKKHKHKK